MIYYEATVAGLTLCIRNKFTPMKNFRNEKIAALSTEKESARILMDKMKLSKKEYLEIINKYGVDASKIIEVMQMGRYPYVRST